MTKSRTIAALGDGVALNPRAYGALVDGVTDDGPAFYRTLNAAAALKLPVEIPIGTMLVTTANTAATGIGYIPPAGVEIFGHGPASIIRYRNNNFAGAYLFSVRNNGLRLRDFKIELDKGTQTWAAGIGYENAATSDHVVERITFEGVTTAVGHWASHIQGVNVSRVRELSCNYIRTEEVIHKTNADTSAQADWLWDNPYLQDVVDGISINSPNGSFQRIVMRNIRVKTASQFPIGFAGPNCAYVRIEGYSAEECNLEALHFEDACHHINVTGVSTYRVNLSVGSFGGSGGATGCGASYFIGGCHHISVQYDDCNLTGNSSGSPNGARILAGGARVSDGLTVDPFRITISGRIRMKTGCQAVIAENTDIRTELDIENDNTARGTPIFTMNSCRRSGRVRIKNPGVILATNDLDAGVWDELAIESEVASTPDYTNPFPGLTSWATGMTAGAHRVAGGLAKRITFSFVGQVETTSIWRNLCPAPYTMHDAMVRREYSGTDHGYQEGKLNIVAGAISSQSWHNIEGGAVTMNPGGTGWQIASGVLQFRGNRATTLVVDGFVTIDGTLSAAA
jgi:hypothetical protein